MLGYLSPMAFEKKRLAEKERARHAIEFFIRVASAVRQALCLRDNRSSVRYALHDMAKKLQHQLLLLLLKLALLLEFLEFFALSLYGELRAGMS